MNYHSRIHGCLKRIEIYYKQTIKNKYSNDLKLEMMHYNTLHKQINKECDIIIIICKEMISLVDRGLAKNIVLTTKDNGDME